MLGSRGDGDFGGGGNAPVGPSSDAQPAGPSPTDSGVTDDDIPFSRRLSKPDNPGNPATVPFPLKKMLGPRGE